MAETSMHTIAYVKIEPDLTRFEELLQRGVETAAANVESSTRGLVPMEEIRAHALRESLAILGTDHPYLIEAAQWIATGKAMPA